MSSKTETLLTECAKAVPAAGAVILGWLEAPLPVWQARAGMVVLVLQGIWWIAKIRALRRDKKGDES